MKRFFAALTIAAMATASATAAPIVTIDGPTNLGGFDYFTVNLNGNGAQFDTIDFSATAIIGEFANTENDPTVVLFAPAGTSADTDFLGLNTVAVGVTVVGSDDSNTLLAGAVTRLGGSLSDFNNGLAQLVIPEGGGGIISVAFAAGGQPVFPDDGGDFVFGIIPEPTSIALVGLALAGVSVRRRK